VLGPVGQAVRDSGWRCSDGTPPRRRGFDARWRRREEGREGGVLGGRGRRMDKMEMEKEKSGMG